MPSTDSLDFGRLNLNESEVISHLCSVAVEKCQDRAERRRAGCGGNAMRKRVLIKNFVAELIRKQQERELEDDLEEEEEENSRHVKRRSAAGKENADDGADDGDDEFDDDEEDELNASMVLSEEEEEDDEVEEGDEIAAPPSDEESEDEDEELAAAAPTQVPRREWYHSSSGSGACLLPSSPSPPLDDDDRARGLDQPLWNLPPTASSSSLLDPLLLPSSPDSMAMHLRDPYEQPHLQLYPPSTDPYASLQSSYFLSPPPDDDGAPAGGALAPWHDTEVSSSVVSSSGSGVYTDYYSHHHHTSSTSEPSGVCYAPFDLGTTLFDSTSFSVVSSSCMAPLPPSEEEGDAAFLALGTGTMAEMKNYSLLDCDVSRPPADAVLFDLSSSPSSGKKRRSNDNDCTLASLAADVQSPSKRLKL